MAKVKVSEVTRYGFECPHCGDWGEYSDLPDEGDTLTCENCGEELDWELE